MSGVVAMLRIRRIQYRRRDHGAVAVEFALVLPILVTLLLGTVTVGITYTQSLGVTNAVREGARFGAIAQAPGAPASPDWNAWAVDVIGRVRQTQFDDRTSSPVTAICVGLYKNGTQVAAPVCDQGDGSVQPALGMPAPTAYPKVPAAAVGPTATCVVRVMAARNFEINVAMAKVYKGVNKRGSVARYERDC